MPNTIFICNAKVIEKRTSNALDRNLSIGQRYVADNVSYEITKLSNDTKTGDLTVGLTKRP